MYKRLSSQDKIALIKRVLKGESISSLCREEKISRTILYKWLKEYKKAPKSAKKALAAKNPSKNKHYRKLPVRKEGEILKLALKDTSLSPHRIAKLTNVSSFFVWKVLKDNNLNTKSLRDAYVYRNGKSLIRPLDRNEKTVMIRRFQNNESISEICKDFSISRTTFYKWLKRFKESREDSLESLRPKEEKHWRFVPGARELVLGIVATSPSLSVHKISKELTVKTGKHVLSSYGVHTILKKLGLNTYQSRLKYASSQVSIDKEYQEPADWKVPIFGKIPSISAIPPPVKNFIKSYYLFLVLFFPLVFVSSLIIKVIFSATSILASIGFLFAITSLTFGMFFFLYSLKYYITIAIVLSFSRYSEEENKEEKRGSFLAKLFSLTNGKNGKNNYQGGSVYGGRGSLIADLSKVTLSRNPFVSIHLATYNEKRVIDRLLTAATSMDYENYEVIIVDDSNDETVELLNKWKKHPKVKIINRPNRAGYKGGALSFAQKEMDKRTEFICIFDADFIPYPDTIVQFLKYFQNTIGNLSEKSVRESNIAAVQGYQWHVLNKSENWITRGVRSEYAGSYVIERSGEEIYQGLKQISGSVYMMRSDVLNKIGWGTSITEDFQLTLKLYEKGYKVVYTPYIQAPAEAVSTVKRLIRQRMRWAEGHSQNVKKMFAKLLFGDWKDEADIKRSFPYTYLGVEKTANNNSGNRVDSLTNLTSLHSRHAKLGKLQMLLYNLIDRRKDKQTNGKAFIKSPLTLAEKFEFIYLTPYYLQALFFIIGTFSWLMAEMVFQVQLPFWTSIWGWSLVFTNLFALPLMNLVGLFLEEAEERDYLGLLSFVALSYLLAPFQGYASLKGFVQKEEGPWFRTPKTGRITDIFTPGKFYRYISGFLGRERATSAKPASAISNMVSFLTNNKHLALVTANNRFDGFKILPKKKGFKVVGRSFLATLLIVTNLLFSAVPYVPHINPSTVQAQGFGVIGQEESSQSTAKAKIDSKVAPLLEETIEPSKIQDLTLTPTAIPPSISSSPSVKNSFVPLPFFEAVQDSLDTSILIPNLVPTPNLSQYPISFREIKTRLSDWLSFFRDRFKINNNIVSKRKLTKKSFEVNKNPEILMENTDVEKVEVKIINNEGKKIEANLKVKSIEGDKITAEVIPSQELKPGKHTLETTYGEDDTAEDEFFWGVLAVNFYKSSYLLNEEALIGVGVLDDSGKTLCNALVKATIETPGGKLEQVNSFSISSTCADKSVTENPDYFAIYTPKEEGTYKVTIIADTENGQRQVEDSFIVKESNFVIERSGAMRIYPVANYDMRLKVLAKENVDGSFLEKVPVEFNINKISQGGTVEEKNGVKEISWHVSVKAGSSVEVSYNYKAPDRSPEFYLLGKAQLITGGKVVFEEPRQWQIAADTPTTPTFKAAGTFTAGTDAITPPYPTGGSAPVANDIAILVVTSENEAISLTTANGFVELGAQANKAAGTAASDPASRLAVYWKRCAGSDSDPVVADSGNNTEGQIYLFSGVRTTGNPWDVYAEGNDSAANDTSGVIPGATTTIANTLVVAISSSSYNRNSTTEFSSWTNANLSSLTEQGNNTSTSGLGGGHGLATGIKATASAIGNTTVTLANTSYKGAMSIALAGIAPTPPTLSDLTQYRADNQTVIATGGSMPDGITTNLYLESNASGSSRTESFTPKVEVRDISTSFSDTVTNTGDSVQYDAENPDRFRGACSVYDDVNKRLVMWGGYLSANSPGYTNDTWVLSLKENQRSQWQKLTVSGSPPQANLGHVCAYDSLNDRLVVYGGWDGSTYLTSVWFLSLPSSGTPTWTHPTVTGSPPSSGQQLNACAVYDSSPSRMIIYGGYYGADVDTDVVYQLTLPSAGNPTWSDLGLTTGPSATGQGRDGQTCVSDSDSDRMVMYGGHIDAQTNEVWSLNLASGSEAWTQISPTGDAGARQNHFAAIQQDYTGTDDRMIIFAGTTNKRDVWELTLPESGGSTWTDKTPAVGIPGQRTYGATPGIWDPLGDRAIFVGGYDGTFYYNEAITIIPSASGNFDFRVINDVRYLRERDAMSTFFDSANNQMVMFGGSSRGVPATATYHVGETWKINTSGTPVWKDAGADTAPPPRELASMVYDPLNSRGVMCYGIEYNTVMDDCWSISLASSSGKSNWTNLNPSGTVPTARRGATSIYDELNDRMVLFGGRDQGGAHNLNDTQFLSLPSEEGSTSWQAVTVDGTPPSIRWGGTAIYDPGRDRMIVFGGTNDVSYFQDVYSLSLPSSGNPTWSTLSPTGTKPATRRGHVAVYDPDRGDGVARMVVFGGFDGTNHYNDVWELTLPSSGDGVWTQLSPSGTLPALRRSHGAAYDSVNDRMIIFGGRNTDVFMGDTWSISLGSSPAWTDLNPSVTVPVSVAVTGLTKDTSYHWQAWVTGDSTGDSSKVAYGGNSDTPTAGIDFTIAGINLSGYIYTDEGSTSYLCQTTGNLTVNLRVNGAGSYTATCNADTGAWSINSVLVTSGQIVIVYLSAGSVRGSIVLASDVTAKTDLNIYQNRVILRDDVNGSITNSEINSGQVSGTTDDMVSVSAGALTVDSAYETHIYAGDTFVSGGDVSTGKLHIPATSTYTGVSETLTLTGSGSGTSRPLYNQGTFTAASNTTIYTGTSASDIEAATYNVLQFTPASGSPVYTLSSGTTTISSNTTIGDGTNAVTISTTGNNPTVNASGSAEIKANATLSGSGTGTITVNGNVTGAGTVNLTDGTFDHRSTATTANFGSNSGTNNWTFNNLTFSNGTTSTVHTFGNTNIGTTVSYKAVNYFLIQKFTLGVSANITALRAYMLGDTTQVMKGAIYAADGVGGAPGTWLGSSTETSSPNGTTWATLSFASPVALTAGDYYLGVHFGAGVTATGWYYTGSAGATTYYGTNDTYSDGEANPNVLASTTVSSYSVYAEYMDTDDTTISTSTGGTGQIIVGGTLQVGKGTDSRNTTLDNETYDRIIDANSNVDITSKGILQASSTVSFTIAGNFTNNGSFTAGSGTITFDDGSKISTLNYSAATTFYGLTVSTASKELDFDNVDQTNVTNLTVSGQACGTKAKLYSDSAGNQFDLNVTGTTSVLYADIKDSNNIVRLGAINSSDSGNNSNWIVTSDACGGSADGGITNWSHQRKTFQDELAGSLWRFSYDSSNTNIKIEYSTDSGSNWTPITALGENTADFSVWVSGGSVYIAFFETTTNTYDIRVRKGTLSATNISWGGSDYAALDGSSTSSLYHIGYITQDSSGYLWVLAQYYDGTNYYVKAVKSSSANDPSAWGAANDLSSASNTDPNVYGSLSSLGSTNMYSVWIKGTAIEGSKYTGTWAAADSIGTGNVGFDNNFSMSSDTSNNLHLAYIDGSSYIQYKKYNGTSWDGSPTRLDTSATNKYVTVSVDSDNNDIYAIYIRGTTAYYKKYSGSWGSETDTGWTMGTNPKHLTSNYSNLGAIFAEWTSGTGPYAINWNYIIIIPERLWFILSLGLIVPAFLKRRRKFRYAAKTYI